MMDNEARILLVQKSYQQLLIVRDRIVDDALRSTVDFVLSSADFQSSPAASKHHHVFEGGLLAHTAQVLSVIENLLLIPELSNLNKDILYTAAIWHDFGKIHCYLLLQDEPVKKTFLNVSVGHLAMALAEFYTVATLNDVSQVFVEQIAHCLVSHHGFSAWEAIKQPATREAWVLHLADMISVFGFGIN